MYEIGRHNQTITVTIASGGTTSGPIDFRGHTVGQIMLPAAFTGTSLTFTSSDTSTGTFQACEDDLGNPVSITVGQGKNYAIPASLAGCFFLKIVSGSSEGADRTIKVVCKG